MCQTAITPWLTLVIIIVLWFVAVRMPVRIAQHLSVADAQARVNPNIT